MTVSDENSFFTALVQRYPHPFLQEGIRALPSSWQTLCHVQSSHREGGLESFLDGYDRIQSLIDPSWNKRIFELLPKEISDSLSFLPPGLARLFTDYATLLSPFHSLPEVSAFPGNEFSFLLQATKEELEEVIELFSLFPLLDPYLKVVDKKRLSQIAGLLNERQRKWLSFLLFNPKRFFIEPIELADILEKEGISGKKELFERGIHLFAQALVGEDEAFVRLVCYKLDISLGEKIVALTKQLQKPEALVKSAFHFVIEFIKKSRRGVHS